MRAPVCFAAVMMFQVHQTAEAACHDVRPVFRNGSGEEREAAAEGLRRADAFMKAGDACVKGPFKVSVVFSKKIKGVHKGDVSGSYDTRRRMVTLTSMPKDGFGAVRYLDMPMTRGIYVSIAAHEFTHVMSSRMYVREPDTTAQEEYVAYAGQTAGMSEEERTAISERHKVSDDLASSEDFINPMFIAMAPGKFARGVMTHFASERGGVAFLRKIWSWEWRPGQPDF